MSELRKLRARHAIAIQELQDSCVHPSSVKMPVKVEPGVWGEALFCSVCGKQLVWVEEPKRTHEITATPIEWIR